MPRVPPRRFPPGTHPLVAGIVRTVAGIQNQQAAGRLRPDYARRYTANHVNRLSRETLGRIDQVPPPQLDVIGQRLGVLEGTLGFLPRDATALRQEVMRRLGMRESEDEIARDARGPVLDAMIDVALAATRNPRLLRPR
jgi:hypothetical protein